MGKRSKGPISIYKVTSPSGKYYIGITKDTKTRWKKHKRDSQIKNSGSYGTYFKCAIRKYKDQLKWEVIDLAINYEVANELEKRYILHFDSFHSGYNMTLGGTGGTLPELTNEEIIIEAKKYKGKHEWSRYGRRSYGAARENQKLFETCTRHMVNSNLKWTRERILLEAKKYFSRSKWKKNSCGSYTAAIKDRKLFTECVAHMPANRWFKYE